MRLVCPNCDAEYEVDDSAIPQAGRDVQCSNCGHAWFQIHPEVEAERAAEEALYEAPAALPETAPAALGPESVMTVAAEPQAGWEDEAEDVPVPPVAFRDPDPAAPLTAEQAVAATLSAAAAVAEPKPVAPPIAPARGLDASVLAVLREEAEREVAARKTEQPGIETQVEMGLDDDGGAGPASGGLASAMRRIARLKGGAEPEAVPVVRTRRELLPAIEEINSTLRATSDRRSEEDYASVDSLPDLKAARSGFGRGFTLLVVLAVIIVALYLAAPLIAAKVPALAGTAQTYVDVVDGVRLWLDTQIKALIATLRGYEGGQAG